MLPVRLGIVLFLTCAFAAGEAGDPKFEDYPAGPVFGGAPAAPKFRTSGQRMFRTAIREAEEKGPNFAGGYTIAEWGCGTGCVSFVVVNTKSGLVYDAPFGKLPRSTVYLGPPPDLASMGILYRLNSKLLVVVGCPNWKDCARYFYEWTGSGFKLLQRSSIPSTPPVSGKGKEKRAVLRPNTTTYLSGEQSGNGNVSKTA